VGSVDAHILPSVAVAITALDVAFMSSIAALIASVAAPVAAILIARNNREHERQLAREERGFDARRSAYENTLTDIGATLYYAQKRVDDIREGRCQVADEDLATTDTDEATYEQWARDRALIATIANTSIMAAHAKHADAQVAFWQRVVVVMRNSGPIGSAVNVERAAELQPLLGHMYSTRTELEERIRTDLRGAPS